MSTSELAGVYDLPVPVWVEHEAFGARTMTGLRGLPFEVRLPHRTVLEGLDMLSPPELPGVSDDHEKLASRPWAMNYMAEPTAPSMALCRIGLVCEVNDENAARSRFTDEVSQSHRVGDALVERIESWFDGVRSWAEVSTGQDLDFKHPVADAEDPAEGLLLAEDGDLQSSGHGRFTMREVVPVTLAQWIHILALAAAGRKPPVEYLLMRDANAANVRGLSRRAVLDAATATEIVLNRALTKAAEAMPDGARQKYLKKQRMLGTLMTDLKEAGVEFEQPWADLRSLADLRNDAIHSGSEPDPLEAAVAVMTAGRFVNQNGTLS